MCSNSLLGRSLGFKWRKHCQSTRRTLHGRALRQRLQLFRSVGQKTVYRLPVLLEYFSQAKKKKKTRKTPTTLSPTTRRYHYHHSTELQTTNAQHFSVLISERFVRRSTASTIVIAT